MTLFTRCIRMKDAIILGAEYIREKESEACLKALASQIEVVEVEKRVGNLAKVRSEARLITPEQVGFVFSLGMLDQAFLELEIIKDGVDYRPRIHKYHASIREMECELEAICFRSVPWSWSHNYNGKRPHGWAVSHQRKTKLREFQTFWLCGNGVDLCNWLKV